MTAWTPADLHDAVPEDLRARMPVAVWSLGIRAVTFDCYGTLIDWESGIAKAMSGMFTEAGRPMYRRELLRAFARHERDAESGPYLTYREVLDRVESALLAEFGLAARSTGRLATSLASWAAFDETPGALAALKRRFRLGVLSNVDDDLFAGSAPRLGAAPDLLVTAQQVGSYKPGRRHFVEALRRLMLRPDEVLHVAESRFHDVEPAGALGFRTCWVNRHAADGDTNATSASGPMNTGRAPDLTVGSLAELVKQLGA